MEHSADRAIQHALQVASITRAPAHVYRGRWDGQTCFLVLQDRHTYDEDWESIIHTVSPV